VEAKIPDRGAIVAALAVLAGITTAAAVAAAVWPWRVEISWKATTMVESARHISLAAGLEVAGLSASAGAILGGPGVVAVHARERQLWRRAIADVSLDSLLAWLEAPAAPAKRGAFGRALSSAKEALLARTDLGALPELGLGLLLGLRAVALRGDIRCGFVDPGTTGRAAAVLYPIAGVLAPFGTFGVSFDFSGREVLEGSADISFRITPARVVGQALRFVWLHVHLRQRPVSEALPASST
jgi:hypothetical protein